MIIAVVSAVAAFAAAIFSATVAGRLARQTKISEFRQQWINDQRLDITDYLVVVKRHQQSYDDPAISDDAAPQDRLRPTREKAECIYYRIKLRINPRSNPHKGEDDRFIRALDRLLGSTALPNRHPEFAVLFNDAVAEAQEFLKREWEVTKKGK